MNASLSRANNAPDLNTVSRFIAANDARFDGSLSGFMNYSRVVSLAGFDRLMGKLNLRAQAHIGVISGSLREPELKFVSAARTTILSFEDDKRYDLDLKWTDPSQEFSLTLCNQALEHVFNPHMAFENLVRHTAPGGYLYVTIPTVNCIHGEPYYYSAGFHPRFLERLGITHNLELADIGFWGSYKYMIYAVTGIWLPEKWLRRGIHRRGDLRHPSLIIEDGRFMNEKFMTDCWALYRKPLTS
jgi:SAM-dependent methyltransferase